MIAFVDGVNKMAVRRSVSAISMLPEQWDDLQFIMKHYNVKYQSRMMAQLVTERAVLLKKNELFEDQQKLPHAQEYDKRLKFSIQVNETAKRKGFDNSMIDLDDPEDLLCNPYIKPACFRCSQRYLKIKENRMVRHGNQSPIVETIVGVKR